MNVRSAFLNAISGSEALEQARRTKNDVGDSVLETRKNI